MGDVFCRPLLRAPQSAALGHDRFPGSNTNGHDCEEVAEAAVNSPGPDCAEWRGAEQPPALAGPRASHATAAAT
jgi:hypothetical protein